MKYFGEKSQGGQKLRDSVSKGRSLILNRQ